MPITITPDLVEYASCTEDANGITIVRGHLVEGLPVGSATLIAARTADDGVNRILQWGEPHPDDPTLQVARVEPKPFLAKSKDAAIVLETYRPPDLGNITAPIVRFTGTTRDIQTSFDANGKRIQVAYKPGIGKAAPAPITKANARTGRVTAPKAFGILTVDRVVYEDPSPKLAYLNCISSAAYRGFPRWSWWVRNLTIEKQLFRSGWREHWEIELDGDLYTKVAVWRDLNGEIPEDVYGGLVIDRSTEGVFNGATVARVNGQKDLNAIGLPPGF